MKLLPIVLFISAAAVLLLGLARVGHLVRYNQRRRRRRRRPRRLDAMTVLLFPMALALVIAAVLTLPQAELPDEADTQPTGESQTAPPQTSDPSVGWQEENGVRVYLDENGEKTTGWLELEGRRYYFHTDGAMAQGWTEVDSTEYYFREDGSMARGEVEIDGVKHHFDSNGQRVLLVNPWNEVPQDYTPDLVTLSSKYAVEGCSVDRSCLEDLQQMIDDCNAASPTAYVVSAFRDFDHQTRNYNRKVNYYLNKGYSRADAEKEAATVVAVPGTSEHHLGLAVDIIDTRLWDLTEEQANQPAQQWLMENSWRYGFIFRYPQGKLEITGIIYEPWHYRYVGRELAEEIHSSGLTLEEYLDSLS